MIFIVKQIVMKNFHIKLMVFAMLSLLPLISTAQSFDLDNTNFDIQSEYRDESQWRMHGGDKHLLTMNYTMLFKGYANGLWTGGLGYAAGMWLSGNKTGWGVVGSLLAVNIPILVDGDYDKEEMWIGKNLGALTVSVGATFIIEVNQRGKMRFAVPKLIRRR
jgi:hypothetical protein